jgi:hypothetical protein
MSTSRSFREERLHGEDESRKQTRQTLAVAARQKKQQAVPHPDVSELHKGDGPRETDSG